MSFALHRIRPDIVQITLPVPGIGAPFGTPHNVYLLTGATGPTLVGTGHPLSFETLSSALQTLGVAPADVCRIVAVDWSPAQLGAATHFPKADLFALSPDMVQPSGYRSVVTQEEGRWRRALSELREDDAHREAMDLDAFEAALGRWFGGLPAALPIIPLRGGHTLQLGDHRFQVLDTPGPCPGHAVLYDRKGGLLFSSKLLVEHAFGDPYIEEMKALLMSIERVFDLKPTLLMPSVGLVDDDAAYSVRRSHRRMTGLLSNLPYALQGPMTVPRLLFRNLGYIPSQVGRFLHTARLYEACFDELIRTAVIMRQGSGLWSVYGTEAPDARVSRG